MRKISLLSATIFSFQVLLLSNPIDNTSKATFSELFFDSENNWTMEVFFPFKENSPNIDSIIFYTSDQKTKLIIDTNFYDQDIIVIDSSNFTNPISINPEGDKITIYTYSHHHDLSGISLLKMDTLSFGNYPGASVGRPDSGYSIYRVFWDYSYNTITVDCLNSCPTIGVVNDTVGLSAILRGHIYDSNNRLVTKLKPIGYGDIPYFILQTPLEIDTNGAYLTKIFPVLCSPDKLTARLEDFRGPIDFVDIEPFKLENIRPKTEYFQDIHLKDDWFVVEVNSGISIPDYDYKLINYPNPFNLSTNFYAKFPIGMQSKAGKIDIFNMIGQRIKSIPITHGSTVSWDGKNDRRSVVASGVYYYSLNIDNKIIKTGSMILIK